MSSEQRSAPESEAVPSPAATEPSIIEVEGGHTETAPKIESITSQQDIPAEISMKEVVTEKTEDPSSAAMEADGTMQPAAAAVATSYDDLEEKSPEDSNSDNSESDDEEEDGIIVITGDAGGAQPIKKRVYERGSNTYVRPDAFKDIAEGGEEEADPMKESDLDKLRFARRLTAFDTDIDDDTIEQPWRKMRTQRTDLSDFFNYGFTEATWKIYCEKQLRYRAEQGLGPSEATSAYQPSIA